MTKLSLILPCYNVEPFIARCLDSLVTQDISLDEYEIICVNDCSPDHLSEVVHDYQKHYDNIHLIEHTVNKTAGGARNTGLETARGEYVWFIDPDDIIIPRVLGKIYGRAKELSLDVLFFNLICTKESGQQYQRSFYRTMESILSGQSFVINNGSEKGLYGVASHVSCILRREFCINNKIVYPQIRSSQDVVFIWNAVLHASKVSSISDVCYHVIKRPDSTTGSQGRLKPEATLSASLLYANELQNIIERTTITEQRILADLKMEIRQSLNNDSRNVVFMTVSSLRLFRQLCMQRTEEIERLAVYMNKNTKRVFNYRVLFPFWFLGIKWISLKMKVRN